MGHALESVFVRTSGSARAELCAEELAVLEVALLRYSPESEPGY